MGELAGPALGAGASRLIHGSDPQHERLEAELADWVGLPASLLFTSGYAANVGLISALGVAGSLIVSDVLNHASIIDGCRLSRAEVRVVEHCSVTAVAEALRAARSHSLRWVVTESYFSMDGDGPDLRELSDLCAAEKAGLIIDEAHALGVFGPSGAGRAAEAGVRPDVLVGTLGKAVGAQGAFVAGSARLRAFLWNRARSFVFSTAPSPVLTALTRQHVACARGADALRAHLRELVHLVRERLAVEHLPVGPASFGPIIPLIVGPAGRTMALAANLRSVGILAQAIRPPTVAPDSCRLRLTLNAKLTRLEAARLADRVVEAWHAS